MAMRKRFEICAKKTCVFGRSAGGYLIGAAVARNPLGEMFGTAYAEAPYVDVLQTASNPSLPLTVGEYSEFGNPSKNIAELETMLRLGPVTALGPEGAPGIFVLCRVSENDRLVYAYESLKWIDALGRAENLIHVQSGQGHAIHGEEKYREYGEDFLILSQRLK
jgi:oligopeptidase B